MLWLVPVATYLFTFIHFLFLFSSLIPGNKHRYRKWPTLLYSMRHINIIVTLAFYGLCIAQFFSPCHFLRPSQIHSALFGVFGLTADSIVSSCVVLHMISYFLCSIQSKYLNRFFFDLPLNFVCFFLHHTHFINSETSHLFIKQTINGQFEKSGIAMRRIVQGLVRCDENSVWKGASPYFQVFKRI